MRQRFQAFRRTTVTGAIVVAAYMMYLMIPGFGGGAGQSNVQQLPSALAPPSMTTPEVDATEASSEKSLASDNVVANTALAAATSRDDLSSNNATGGDELASWISEGVVTLMIDEYDYFAAIPGGDNEPTSDYHPISLQQAVKLASLAPGDSNGIRVRILRRDTARAAAEHRLHQTLTQAAGVSADAIYMASELIP